MTESINFAFIHGGGQGSWIWDETLATLGQQTSGASGRAIAFDLLGCGVKRSYDTTGLTTDDVVAELVADLSRSGLKNIVLVGHSNAGTIIPRVVERLPHLIRQIVYATCNAPLPGQSVHALMGSGPQGSNPDEVGWPFDPKFVTDHGERFRLMFCNDMSEGETLTFMAMLGRDRWPNESATHETAWRYDHLETVPSSYVVCLKDRILPVVWQETFAARLKARRLVRLDAGHQAMKTRPHALAEILRHEAHELLRPV